MSTPIRRWVRPAILLLLAATSAILTAQSSTPAPSDPLIRDLRWRNIGNANLIGRISAIDALDSDFAHVIVGSASGGVWKSVNAGTTWTTIFDSYGAASIGDVRIIQKNPQHHLGRHGRRMRPQLAPRGATASTSPPTAAQTFTNMGLKDSYNIGKIVLHPTNDEHRVRRGDRQHLGADRRARRLQDDRRRQDVDEARRTACRTIRRPARSTW